MEGFTVVANYSGLAPENTGLAAIMNPPGAAMIIPDIDDLVLEYDEESGIEEVGRRVLSRGPWTTVAFLVKTRRESGSEWEGPFLWLHRYQKVPQGWKLVSRFHTTEPEQLANLLEAIRGWELI